MSNPLVTGASKVLGSIQKTKPIQKLGNAFNKNPEQTLAYLTVGSIVIKDGVGCYKYVTQSMHNDKIPEEKRKFVAALDLTNGVLMILAQIGMFFAMRKMSEPIFNKVFKKSFNDKNAREIPERIRMMQKKEGEVPGRKLTIAKEYNSERKEALDLFKFVLDISAATILGKRVIVPFIATPLADKVKKKMDEHSGSVQPAEAENKTATKQAEGQKLNVVSAPVIDTNLLTPYRHAVGYRQ